MFPLTACQKPLHAPIFAARLPVFQTVENQHRKSSKVWNFLNGKLPRFGTWPAVRAREAEKARLTGYD